MKMLFPNQIFEHKLPNLIPLEEYILDNLSDKHIHEISMVDYGRGAEEFKRWCQEYKTYRTVKEIDFQDQEILELERWNKSMDKDEQFQKLFSSFVLIKYEHLQKYDINGNEASYIAFLDAVLNINNLHLSQLAFNFLLDCLRNTYEKQLKEMEEDDDFAMEDLHISAIHLYVFLLMFLHLQKKGEVYSEFIKYLCKSEEDYDLKEGTVLNESFYKTVNNQLLFKHIKREFFSKKINFEKEEKYFTILKSKHL